MDFSLRQAKLFIEVAKFNASEMLAYPWELVGFLAQRVISLSFLALFWYAVSQSSTSIQGFKSLIAYFLVSSAIREVTFSQLKFGKKLMNIIKNGEISNYLIKPLPSVSFLFFAFLGKCWMFVVYSVCSVTIGLIILPPQNFSNVIAFVIFLVLSLVVSLSFNILTAIMAFYLVEASGIRNVFLHIIRILSGAIIPLTFFPNPIYNLIILSPFPLLAFTPTYVLQNTLATNELLRLFAISMSWAIGLSIISVWAWRKALRRYDGVGI